MYTSSEAPARAISAYPNLIHLYASTIADSPEAQAELTVSEGPLNLCCTPIVAAGMLVNICSIDNLFTDLKSLAALYCIYSSILVVLDAKLPKQTPNLSLSTLARSIYECCNA